MLHTHNPTPRRNMQRHKASANPGHSGSPARVTARARKCIKGTHALGEPGKERRGPPMGEGEREKTGGHVEGGTERVGWGTEEGSGIAGKRATKGGGRRIKGGGWERVVRNPR